MVSEDLHESQCLHCEFLLKNYLHLHYRLFVFYELFIFYEFLFEEIFNSLNLDTYFKKYVIKID